MSLVPESPLQSRRPTVDLVLGVATCPIIFGMSRYGAIAERDENDYFKAKTNRYDIEDDQWAMHRAIDLGYNFFDTARAYGRSEELLGETLADYGKNGFLVATKVGINPNQNVPLEIERSLENFGLPIGVLYAHNRWDGVVQKEVDRFLWTLGDAQSRGLARSIGICNFRPDELRRAIDLLGNSIGFYQAKLNFIKSHSDAAELLDVCRNHGITFTASSALDRNNALDKKKLDPRINQIAWESGMTAAQLAIAAIRSLGAMPVVQSHNGEHMRENLDALREHSVRPEDMTYLQAKLLGQP